jgi:uncharacterized protein YndB with AHSA1/START domain
MDATKTSDATAERTSERELVVTRTINGPARIVFDAWTRPDLFKRWWTPKSFPITLRSVDMDARVGGSYRLEFGYEGSTFEFFGRYVDVTRPSRLVWTNDEDPNAPVTTATFEETDGRTVVVVHERYPSREALDDAIASGSSGMSGMPEQLAQLDELVATLDGGTASA